MEEILPNLLPAVVTLVLWLVSSPFKGGSRMGRALWWGFFLAFIATFVMAVPPFLLASINGFRGLGMVWMITYIMSLVGPVVGLIVFAIGFGASLVSSVEKDSANGRSDPREDAH